LISFVSWANPAKAPEKISRQANKSLVGDNAGKDCILTPDRGLETKQQATKFNMCDAVFFLHNESK
jgi:hypothetical protein